MPRSFAPVAPVAALLLVLVPAVGSAERPRQEGNRGLRTPYVASKESFEAAGLVLESRRAAKKRRNDLQQFAHLLSETESLLRRLMQPADVSTSEVSQLGDRHARLERICSAAGTRQAHELPFGQRCTRMLAALGEVLETPDPLARSKAASQLLRELYEGRPQSLEPLGFPTIRAITEVPPAELAR